MRAILPLLIALVSPVALQARATDLDPINDLSPNYQPQARYTLSNNDVKSFIYRWFAAFDHQREAGYFLNRIASPIEMHYPGAPIRSEQDFLNWYKGVTDTIIWNSHQIDQIEVSGSQKLGWEASYRVRWQAREKSGATHDVMVAQRLYIIRRGDQLKIARLQAEILPEPGHDQAP